MVAQEFGEAASLSEDMNSKIDAEIKKLIDEAYMKQKDSY